MIIRTQKAMLEREGDLIIAHIKEFNDRVRATKRMLAFSVGMSENWLQNSFPMAEVRFVPEVCVRTIII